MNIDIYSTQGKKTGTATLSDTVFDTAWNPDLVHQAVTVFAGNLRQGSANTKDRGEVSGGGRKPWKQKGTGQARHGSKRSPIWRHGGITFGPTSQKVYTRSLTKSMKVVSLCSALSQKLRDEQVLFVDVFDNSLKKTKAIASQFKNLTAIDGFSTLCTLHNSSNVLLVVPEYDAALLRAIKNLPYVSLIDAENINTYQVANTRYMVIINPEAVNAVLLARREGTVGTSKPSTKKEKRESTKKDEVSPKPASSKKATKKVATK